MSQSTPVSSPRQAASYTELVNLSGLSWFLVYRVLFKFLSKPDAIFLQDLINHATMSRDEADGWFPCPATLLANDWTSKEQDARFKSLKGKGIVHTERRGDLGRRWVCVDSTTLLAEIGKAQAAPKQGERSPRIEVSVTPKRW